MLVPELTEKVIPGTLDSDDHVTWSALHRIHNGRVRKDHDRYLDGGQPVGLLTGATFDVLIGRGLAVLADPRPEDGLSRLSLTDIGAARYAELGTIQFPCSVGGD